MSTYKLWELANRDGVNGLLPYVEDAVLRMSDRPSISRRIPDEVGEPIARYVHSKLMSDARPLRPGDPKPPSPEYTHITFPGKGTRDGVGIKTIVAEMSEGVWDDRGILTVAGALGRHFRYYKLAVSCYGRGSAAYFIRPWPHSLEWQHQANKVMDAATEKRIEEEADKPVTVYRSAKVVVGEIPEKVTPEWAVATIKRMAQAFDRLQERYVKLEERNAELEAQVEALSNDPWAEATKELTEVLS